MTLSFVKLLELLFPLENYSENSLWLFIFTTLDILSKLFHVTAVKHYSGKTTMSLSLCMFLISSSSQYKHLGSQIGGISIDKIVGILPEIIGQKS
jgi:hypothetical protein